MVAEEEKLQQAIVRGAELLVQHGLGDWRVSFHKKRRVLADCNHLSRTIRYSLHFIRIATKEQLEGVTLHEIAHALVGYQHGHDSTFRSKMYELGGDPDYSAAGVKVPVNTYKYKMTCPECGNTFYKSVNRGYNCGRCSRLGKTIPITVVELQQKVVLWPV